MSATARPEFKLTPREIETAVAVLQNLRGGEIKIDYVAMAETLGLKNDKVATAAWCALRKKLFSDGKNPPPKVTAARVTKSAAKKSNQKHGAVVQQDSNMNDQS